MANPDNGAADAQRGYNPAYDPRWSSSDFNRYNQDYANNKK